MAEDEVFDPQHIPANIWPLLDRLFHLCAAPDWPQEVGNVPEVEYDTAVEIMRHGMPEGYARAAAKWAVEGGNKVWQANQPL
jgi:hypothetical protein